MRGEARGLPVATLLGFSGGFWASLCDLGVRLWRSGSFFLLSGVEPPWGWEPVQEGTGCGLCGERLPAQLPGDRLAPGKVSPDCHVQLTSFLSGALWDTRRSSSAESSPQRVAHGGSAGCCPALPPRRLAGRRQEPHKSVI